MNSGNPTKRCVREQVSLLESLISLRALPFCSEKERSDAHVGEARLAFHEPGTCAGFIKYAVLPTQTQANVNNMKSFWLIPLLLIELALPPVEAHGNVRLGRHLMDPSEGDNTANSNGKPSDTSKYPQQRRRVVIAP